MNVVIHHPTTAELIARRARATRVLACHFGSIENAHALRYKAAHPHEIERAFMEYQHTGFLLELSDSRKENL